ncbi:MAG TPA: 30S ribosomal protein S6 [archaeon]|uniref:Small ribosomal subunit protein bS6 n=1 Tax=Candidatus Gottesmanbacteria bacterium RIFCSPHIGHO2_01_FULL_39_10 TaxID=1798375 RepID=A0A1F5ZQN1_9BACT|nr:MAG: 30S ribosomal protein S6 [Candidatus Gottesmanbacteria bacterium RIFCSPHIGHO2_01_FULL_39_10]HLD41756.1 30S ribosomal protein S6 [archaeon]
MVSYYDLIYISKADEEASKKSSSSVLKLLKEKQAKVTKEEDWGKKTLAYAINKEKEGVYRFLQFSLESGKVKEFHDKLKASPEILRFLVLKSEIVKKVPKKEVKKIAKEK